MVSGLTIKYVGKYILMVELPTTAGIISGSRELWKVLWNLPWPAHKGVRTISRTQPKLEYYIPNR
jgi:hypothetical protein